VGRARLESPPKLQQPVASEEARALQGAARGDVLDRAAAHWAHVQLAQADLLQVPNYLFAEARATPLREETDAEIERVSAFADRT